jgi:YVTN family beta-propeller protein
MRRGAPRTVLLCLTLTSCLPDWGPASGDDDVGPDGPPPTTDQWKRASLAPLYRLLPRAEYGRIQENGTTFVDGDLTDDATVTSSADMLDEIGAQLGQEQGVAAIDLIPDAADRERAAEIPFRGNPSDVKLLAKAGTLYALVPLGGDLMTPGHELAVIRDPGGAAEVTRVDVGVRPVRVAVSDGLVFVCNQYSNYVSVVDPQTSSVVAEVPSDFYCADLVIAGSKLYVANKYRKSLLRYDLAISGTAVTVSAKAELAGVGPSPHRLAFSSDQGSLYVGSGRGDVLARVDLAGWSVAEKVSLGAPVIDLAVSGDLVFAATTMPDRGLLGSNDADHPDFLMVPPREVGGIDGVPHVAHPGSLTDSTRSYNFEDVRNGLFQLEDDLSGRVYYTDDIAGEPTFAGGQKVLAGALPQALAMNRDGTRVWVAHGGSDRLQELAIDRSTRPHTVTKIDRIIFDTAARPFALALDEDAGRLWVAAWGGEVLEAYDVTTLDRVASIDLGYASPRYPVTSVERGEYFFYNALWSNNRRKSCASCHLDELVSDGLAYANGAASPTALHKIPANHNLLTSEGYFWNGSFHGGSYRSLAFAAQARTNCEVVLFGLVEGPGSDPSTRVGDPRNRFTNGEDDTCRPVVEGDGLPLNLAEARGVIAAEQQLADQTVLDETGFTLDELSTMIDFYSAAELRLPPNPVAQMRSRGDLGDALRGKVEAGEGLFRGLGCAGCHQPENARSPFSDGRQHGPGADWPRLFVERYAADPRITDVMGQLPAELLATADVPQANDETINLHLDPIDYFIPFCFTRASCLVFDDPLAFQGDPDRESELLDLLVDFNLADPDRGFVPGNVMGRPRINTPSLRGVWTQATYLHHGLASSFAEAILAPGHPALPAGARGFAVSNSGTLSSHGATQLLSASDVEALAAYLMSIE